MRKAIIAIIALACTATASAQGDVEYRMEIGGGVGLMNYTGDYNGNLLKDMQPMAAAVLRRSFNPYSGLKATLAYGRMKGSSRDVETYYPGAATEAYEFSNPLAHLAVVYEQNFLPYGTGREYRGARRFVPYLMGGIGLTYAHTPDDVVTAVMPLGLGVKYRMGDRTNVGVEWSMNFSLSDKLDGSPDPYGIQSSGLFKNTDCYGTLLVTLTYSFMAKCRTCHNDDY